MAALGLIIRRAGMLPHPATSEDQNDITFYGGLKGDGSSYITIPNFTFKRDDTVEIEYSAELRSTGQFLFGSRTPSMSILSLLGYKGIEGAPDGTVSWFAWFNSAVSDVKTDGRLFFGEKYTIKTDIGYSAVAGGTKRRVFLNNAGLYVEMPGDVSQTFTENLYVFASNTTSGAMDTRMMYGVIHSFKVTSYEGEAKLDLVPASRKGEVGLYDKVSKEFYANAGAGQFKLIE